jgi:hypothetical protein
MLLIMASEMADIAVDFAARRWWVFFLALEILYCAHFFCLWTWHDVVQNPSFSTASIPMFFLAQSYRCFIWCTCMYRFNTSGHNIFSLQSVILVFSTLQNMNAPSQMTIVSLLLFCTGCMFPCLTKKGLPTSTNMLIVSGTMWLRPKGIIFSGFRQMPTGDFSRQTADWISFGELSSRACVDLPVVYLYRADLWFFTLDLSRCECAGCESVLMAATYSSLHFSWILQCQYPLIKTYIT